MTINCLKGTIMKFVNTETGEVRSVIGVSFYKGAYWVMSDVPAPRHCEVGELGYSEMLYDAHSAEWDDENQTFWCEVRPTRPWVQYFICQGILTVQIRDMLDVKIFNFRISTNDPVSIIINEIMKGAIGTGVSVERLIYKESRHLKNYDGEWLEV
jgi:hypothetical protein